MRLSLAFTPGHTLSLSIHSSSNILKLKTKLIEIQHENTPASVSHRFETQTQYLHIEDVLFADKEYFITRVSETIASYIAVYT